MSVEPRQGNGQTHDPLIKRSGADLPQTSQQEQSAAKGED